jgi:hypothetical protein
MWTQKELLWLSELTYLDDKNITSIIKQAEEEAHKQEMIAFTHKLFISLRNTQEELKKERLKTISLEHQIEMGG